MSCQLRAYDPIHRAESCTTLYTTRRIAMMNMVRAVGSTPSPAPVGRTAVSRA
jgi:hypothetical protein